MSVYILAAFLLLYGIMVLFHPDIPAWVNGLLAMAAGLVMIVERNWTPRRGA